VSDLWTMILFGPFSPVFQASAPPCVFDVVMRELFYPLRMSSECSSFFATRHVTFICVPGKESLRRKGIRSPAR